MQGKLCSQHCLLFLGLQTGLAELQCMFKVLQENITSFTERITGSDDIPQQSELCSGSWMQKVLCHNKDDLQMESGLTWGEYKHLSSTIALETLNLVAVWCWWSF